MRNLVFTAMMLLLAGSNLYAQGEKYLKAMETNVAQFDSAKTADDYISLAASFERIGNAEKNQWLPYYYAALANITRGFNDKTADKDAAANQASELVKKAEALEPNNAELAILKNMIATLHMMVDPQSRWMQYGAEAGKALGVARQIDPNNPRIYYLEGQSIFGTPPQFGGGKDKAKPLFEKSIQLFKTFKPATALHPKWGRSSAQAMLAKCD